MNIFPAIDLYDGKVVRLFKGDYDKMTVYSDNPLEIANGFKSSGAEYMHVVDLQGAKDNTTANFDVIKLLAQNSGLKIEVGGGIRSEEVIKKYLDSGVMRCILGTIAITDPHFTADMIAKYGEKIAVGVDIKDGFVATHGWTKVSKTSCNDFCKSLCDMGAKTIICTDISKDGVMNGTNLELYRELSDKFSIDIIASGGVSSEDDVRALYRMNIYGAILGKALYTGAVDLGKAIRIAKGDAV